MRLAAWMIVAVAAGWLWPAARAADVHSNGAGGGAWSDPGTWRTRTVPGSNDVVTVAGDDHVVVDLTDEKRIACKELNVDPRGMLSFKRGAGKIVLNVAGVVEAYGAIRMDMSRSGEDSAELRLAGPTPAQRILRLVRGGSLVAGGRADLPAGRYNVRLVSGPVPATNAPPVDPMGRLDAMDGTSVDLLRAELQSLAVTLSGLDNTGATPNERASVVGCRFTDRSTLYLYACDTPLAADNELVTEAGAGIAISVYASTLAEIRGNTIRGPFSDGMVINSSDNMIISNTVEGAGTGLQGHAGNLMIKHYRARKCATGYYLVNAVSGVAEDCVADACSGIAFFVHHTAGLQLINSQAINMATNVPTLNANNSVLTFLNCDIATNQATFVQTPGRTFETQNYLVVHVAGQVPAGSQVAVITANPDKPIPPGGADLNVRNSPAAIGPGGWTPLPASMAALIVRSWMITADNRRLPPPDYILRVLGPPANTNAPPPVLKEIRVKPAADWYRPDPNERKATVEVTVP